MKTAEQKVLKFIDEKNLFNAGDKVLLALSGGPDSVFALIFLHKFIKRLKISIVAAHLNHKLRENAEADEIFCKDLCDSLNIEFHSTSVNIKAIAKKSKLSVEETARNERYKYFEKLAKQLKTDKIVTAHNKNDNLETVLLNLFKGTGEKGLAGIPVKRGKIVRPFLNLTKEEILEYLAKTKTGYRIDESNLSNDFQRNYIRNEIVPLIKGNLNNNIEEAVFRTSQNITEARSFHEKYLNEIIRKDITVKNGEIFIPFELINKLDVFIISEMIIRLAEDEFNIKPGFENLKQIKSLFLKQKGKELELCENLNVLRDEKNIVLYKTENTGKFEEVKFKAGEKIKTSIGILSVVAVEKGEITGNSKGKTEIISADNTDNLFILRLWGNSDKFVPLGMNNFKKVSDFLTDIKIPAREKRNQLVLTNKNNIVWVVGRRIDNRYKVEKTSKKYYKLCLK